MPDNLTYVSKMIISLDDIKPPHFTILNIFILKTFSISYSLVLVMALSNYNIDILQLWLDYIVYCTIEI